MIKTIEELKKQAKDKKIWFYPVHKCSMTWSWCWYEIQWDNVWYFDTSYTQPRTWEDLTECYNMNQPERNKNIKQSHLDELNEVWKFEEIKHEIN